MGFVPRRYYVIQIIINSNSFHGRFRAHKRLVPRRYYDIQKTMNSNSFHDLVPRRYYDIQITFYYLVPRRHLLGSTKSVTFLWNLLLAHTLKYGALCMSWQVIIRLLRGPYIYVIQIIINYNSFYDSCPKKILCHTKNYNS